VDNPILWWKFVRCLGISYKSGIRSLTFFGSIYADLDVECLRSHEILFEQYNISKNGDKSSTKPKATALFGRMGSDTEFGDSIPNAWMASSKGHPFFWLPISYVLDHHRLYKGAVEALTGPIALHKQVNVYQHTTPAELSRQVKQSPLRFNDNLDSWPVPLGHQVIVLNETLIYPYSWSKDGRPFKHVCEFNEFDFDPRRCQKLLRTVEHESFAITYWSHSWTSTGHHNYHLQNAG
jgi:hypothetical protein